MGFSSIEERSARNVLKTFVPAHDLSGCGGESDLGRGSANFGRESAAVYRGTLINGRPNAPSITNEERKARIEKADARRLMTEQKVGAIILSGGTSSLYFANLPMGGGERALGTRFSPPGGKPFLVCPAFENDRAHELLASTPFAQNADVRTWQEDESPYVLLAQGLKDRGVTSGRVGIEETVPFVFADGIAHAAGPSIQLVSATSITAGCRMIKDEHEIACLRLAGQATLRVYEAVYRSLSEGMKQRDVMALIQAAYARVGFPGEASLNIGEYTASPDGSRTAQTIREAGRSLCVR